MIAGCRTSTYDQHGDQKVLLCDLSMGEDIIEHIGHVAFVFFTQCENTLVIMSWKNKAISKNILCRMMAASSINVKRAPHCGQNE